MLGFFKGIFYVGLFLVKPFKGFVYRPSSHTLYALAYLHSWKWIRLVSLHAGWQSYSLSSALALKCIHSGSASYPPSVSPQISPLIYQNWYHHQKLKCMKLMNLFRTWDFLSHFVCRLLPLLSYLSTVSFETTCQKCEHTLNLKGNTHMNSSIFNCTAWIDKLVGFRAKEDSAAALCGTIDPK